MISELQKSLTSTIDVYWLTALLMAQAPVLSSIAVDRQPTQASRLEISIAGATITSGLVNIVGSTNETIAFQSNGVAVGLKDFTSISGITISGILGGQIQIKAVTKSGQPINQEVLRFSALPVRFFKKVCKLEMMPAGQEDKATYSIYSAPDKKMYENDVIYAGIGIFGLTRGQLVHAEDIMDFDGATFMGYYEATTI